MSAVAAGIGHNGGPKLWLPTFEAWRILRPLKMFEGLFYPGLQPQFDQFAAIRRPYYRWRMKDILTTLGLTTNLRLCFDAADGNSLPAASTKWIDTSGNGYDFFRGTTVSAEASDPAINGSADGRTLSEYLSFDGGDCLRYDTTAETWMSNLHKAAAKFCWAGWFSMGSVATQQFLFGTGPALGGSSPPGVNIQINTSAKLGIVCQRSAGAGALVYDSTTLTVPANAWTFIAGCENEAGGAGGSFLQMNATVETYNGAYSSPTATATTQMGIGCGGGNVTAGYAPVVSGTKIGCLSVWEGVTLTQAQLAGIFQTTRKRYGV